MKHFKIILSFLLVVLFVISCQKDSLIDSLEDPVPKEQTLSEKKLADGLKEIPALGEDWNRTAASAKKGDRPIPFKADFFTRRVPEKLDQVNCDDESPFPAPNYQEGGGTGTHLGNFTVVLTFCGGDGGFYQGGEGYLMAANGDKLFVKTPATGEIGQVILILPPGSDPVYDAYFHDPFEICGGTGRFEGASGGGTMDSLVDLWNEDYPFPGPIIPNHRTDHVWTGTLILPNGN